MAVGLSLGEDSPHLLDSGVQVLVGKLLWRGVEQGDWEFLLWGNAVFSLLPTRGMVCMVEDGTEIDLANGRHGGGDPTS